MNIYKYQRSKSFTDLCPGYFILSVFNFFSKTAGLIKTKVHVEPLWDRRMKSCTWDLGHMTKMTAMPIYVKTTLKIFLGLKGQWPWNLVCSTGEAGPINIVQMMILGWPWPIFKSRSNSNWITGICMGKRQNSGFFWSCSLWYQSWLMQSAKWSFINAKG